MNPRAVGALLVLAGAIAFASTALRILRGGFFDWVEALALMSPFVIALFLAAREHWVAILLASIALLVEIPIPLIDKMQPAILTAGMLTLLFLFDVSISKTQVASGFEAKSYAFITVIIILWIVLDPPGSARLSEVGGAGEAVRYAVGGIAFFTAVWVGQRQQLSHDRIRGFLVAALISTVAMHMSGVLSGSWYLGFIYERGAWLLHAILAAWAGEYCVRNRRSLVAFYIVNLIFIGLALMSPHRSRIVFALGISAVVAFGLRRARHALVVLGVILSLGLLAVVAATGGSVPRPIQRSMSLFFQPKTGADLGEVGWMSGFRGELYKESWKYIRRRPLFGKGFAYSRGDVLDYLSMFDYRNRGRVEQYGMTGSYHSTVLALTVFCGVPVGVLFLTVLLRTHVRFASSLRRTVGWERIGRASILGFSVANVGQMLMNGAALDFLGCSMLIGAMCGVMKRGGLDVKHVPAPSTTAPMVLVARHAVDAPT